MPYGNSQETERRRRKRKRQTSKKRGARAARHGKRDCPRAWTNLENGTCTTPTPCQEQQTQKGTKERETKHERVRRAAKKVPSEKDRWTQRRQIPRSGHPEMHPARRHPQQHRTKKVSRPGAAGRSETKKGHAGVLGTNPGIPKGEGGRGRSFTTSHHGLPVQWMGDMWRRQEGVC